ncbi:ribosome maturation protein [Rhodocollybia butyracea]|uniref:Ribosome maturation protein n=1 Tax=Rhodocollybia butyracea TaxID=206335 RepID=A0A9P5Q8S3_9AGAR|nr:ribosome maturation protein [Rhodocollybia butyracea]
MPHELTKVIYKRKDAPLSEKAEEYIVFVNHEEYKKWSEGGTTIPLADVVDSFQVYHSTQGNQGILGKPSKQQLENEFGSSKDVDVVEIILKKGKDQPGEGITTQTFGTNATRGSAVIDNKGKGLSGF